MIHATRPVVHGDDGDAMDAAAGLDGILALSREMLAKAEAGAWDDLAGLESRRHPMLARYFEAIRAAGAGAGDVAGIGSLREINDRIIDLGKIQRRHLVREMTDSSGQRRAAARYRQYTSG